MHSFLICSPDYFSISYEINPWMDTSNNADHFKANEQWIELHDTIRRYADYVEIIKQVEGLPDMVFTANAGLVIPNKHFILSRFRFHQRMGEEEHFKTFFQSRGFEVYEPSLPFEGAGDALFLKNQLICGFGFRTEKQVYEEFSSRFGIIPNFVKLIDSRFYHLDTCFCPLQDDDFLVFLPAFDEESQEKLLSMGKAIRVEEEEATNFACNAIAIDRTVILPTGCPHTMESLQGAGYEPIAVEMTEFIKSGGACKCLTLKI